MTLHYIKRGHGILLKVHENVLSMVGYPSVTKKAVEDRARIGVVSGVRTDIFDENLEASREFRKMSRVLQSNGYKLSEDRDE
jgi:hypothetical protein